MFRRYSVNGEWADRWHQRKTTGSPPGHALLASLAYSRSLCLQFQLYKISLESLFAAGCFEIPRIVFLSGFIECKQQLKAGLVGKLQSVQHGVVFCSKVLFSSVNVAFLTNFLSLVTGQF